MTAWFENFGLGGGVERLTTDNTQVSNVVELDHLTMGYCRRTLTWLLNLYWLVLNTEYYTISQLK